MKVCLRRLMNLLVLLLLISCGRASREGAALRIAENGGEEVGRAASTPALPITGTPETGLPQDDGIPYYAVGPAVEGIPGDTGEMEAPQETGSGGAQPVSATLALATPTAVPTNVPTAPPATVCSPLELHALEDLRMIISDPYHPPPKGHEERHQGVDFSYYRWKGRESIRGEGVRAVLGGVVAMALADSFPYGNVVIVETKRADLSEEMHEIIPAEGGESVYTLYAHMDGAPLVSLGDRVESCQPLGAVGKSGNAGQAHLHLEMRLGPSGSAFTRMGYYTAQATAEEKEAYKLWRTSGVFQHFDPMLALGFPLKQGR